MDGTLFFPIGGALIILALVLSALGIRGRDKFPPSRPVLVGASVIFAAVVACTAALAVVNASDEKDHRDEEIAEEQAEAEEGVAAEQPVAPPAKGEAPAGEAAPTGATQLDVTSPEDGSLVFDPDSLEATAGALSITYANPSPVQHSLAVEGDAAGTLGETEVFTAGEQTVTIDDLPQGQYTYFCTVPGHREGGMEGTLVVQ